MKDLLEIENDLASHRRFRRRDQPQTFCQNQPQTQGFSSARFNPWSPRDDLPELHKRWANFRVSPQVGQRVLLPSSPRSLSPLFVTLPLHWREHFPLLADGSLQRRLNIGLERWPERGELILSSLVDLTDAPSFSRALRVADNSRANAGSPRGTFRRSIFSHP